MAVEAELCGTYDTFNLSRTATTDNGGGNGRMSEYPCNGDLSGRSAMNSACSSEQFDEFKIIRQSWFLKLLVVAAPVIGGKVCGTLPGHGTGQHT